MSKYKDTPYSSKNKIPQKELEKFFVKVFGLAKEMFGTDEDGDPPIQIKIIDRTRFDYLHFRPMPYRSLDEKLNPEILDDRRRIVEINLNQANEQYRVFSHDLQDFLKEHNNERTE